ncbi:MAG: ABC transporter ATP-binding protein [Anaerolineae bacterium]
MGFIMDGLDAEAYDRNYQDSDLVKRIVSYFRPELPRMIAVGVAVTLNTLMYTALPIYISKTLDTLTPQTPNEQLWTITFVVALLGSLGWLFNAIRQRFSSEAIGNVVLRLREDAFDAVVKRDLSFYDQIPSGKIVSRVTSDTQAFAQVVSLTIELVGQVLIVVFLIGYLFTVDLKLTLLTLAIAPFVIFTALAFRKIARQTVTASRRVRAVVSAHVQETVAGIRVAKTFRQEENIFAEFLDVNKQSYRVNLRAGYTFSSIFPILNIIAGLGTAALVYFGGRAALTGELTPGNWYLFIQGLALFWFPLTSIASFWSQFQIGLAAGERVFGLIDAEPRVIQTAHDHISTLRGEIEFSHLDFEYNPNEPVLRDFSLHIRPGETLALVGHTGSGKSSIAKLIARFYEYQGGVLKIDGIDIRTLDLHDYHLHLGVVTQTPFLFDGTVRENIRYGKPDATDEEVMTVARQVGGGDWITGLPGGLDTEVGERGSNLSMGQRQLVALARVLLQNPSIIILDEATASVDPLTETLIQEGLDVVLKGRTSIVIAHRLSTIKNANRIIVLQNGKIIEEGTHESLLRGGGHYAELYNTYFRHQSLEYIESMKELAGD